MSDCCNPADTFWSDQLTAAKAMVTAYNAAILAFATSNIQSYQLDTGQTRQLVSRAALSTLKNTRDSLLSEVAGLEARLGCRGTTHMMPGY